MLSIFPEVVSRLIQHASSNVIEPINTEGARMPGMRMHMNILNSSKTHIIYGVQLLEISCDERQRTRVEHLGAYPPSVY